MKFHVATVGTPKLGFIRPGVELYAKRLSATGGFRWTDVKGGSRETEGQNLLKASASMRIVLDERGEQVTSRQLARKFQSWEEAGQRELHFLIGGADGHSEEVRQSADWIWSLSSLTLQHELALLILVEQLYRARSILRGDPYHRE